MCYLSGASSGVVFSGLSGAGTGVTQLLGPYRIYFDSLSSSIIIANMLANNIVQVTENATSWTLLAGNFDGSLGNNSTSLYRPADVTFDPMGNMYVADRNNHRIQLFLNGQTEGITIAGITGVSGSNATLLNEPRSVKLDSQLNLYVTDSLNHRIQKFLRY